MEVVKDLALQVEKLTNLVLKLSNSDNLPTKQETCKMIAEINN